MVLYLDVQLLFVLFGSTLNDLLLHLCCGMVLGCIYASVLWIPDFYLQHLLPSRLWLVCVDLCLLSCLFYYWRSLVKSSCFCCPIWFISSPNFQDSTCFLYLSFGSTLGLVSISIWDHWLKSSLLFCYSVVRMVLLFSDGVWCTVWVCSVLNFEYIVLPSPFGFCANSFVCMVFMTG